MTIDMLPDPVAVEPRGDFRIWVRFADGVEGELDQSHLKGWGVFGPLSDRKFFEGVHISKHNVVSWGLTPDGYELDVAPETMYARLLGITRDEIGELADEESFYRMIDERRGKPFSA